MKTDAYFIEHAMCCVYARNTRAPRMCLCNVHSMEFNKIDVNESNSKHELRLDALPYDRTTCIVYTATAAIANQTNSNSVFSNYVYRKFRCMRERHTPERAELHANSKQIQKRIDAKYFDFVNSLHIQAIMHAHACHSSARALFREYGDVMASRVGTVNSF